LVGTIVRCNSEIRNNVVATVFIDNLAVVLPSRFAEGDDIGEIAAKVLNDIHLRRIKAKLRWLLSRGEINVNEIQTKAIELNDAELLPYATLDDDDSEADPIFMEAMSMARELIVGRMAKEGLPPPKGLDAHAKALVDGMPEIQERARLRIEARYNAARAAIAEVL
jgi:hypothetical protein